MLLAALCAALFLGQGLLPTRCLLPYPPEFLQPMQAEALAAGTMPEFTGNLTLGDKYHQTLTWDRILQDRLRSGEIPLWTRDIAGGAPMVPQLAQVYQPWNLLLLFLPASGIYGIWYFLQLLLFGFFCYRFLRRINLEHLPSMLGMTSLILGLWIQTKIHHNIFLTTAMPAFAILSCVHHIMVHRGGLGHMAMLAAALGLSWLGSFAPVSLQISYLAVAYALYLACKNPRGQRLAPLLRVACAMLLGFLLASAQWWPLIMAKEVSSRGDPSMDVLRAQALPFELLSNLVWPSLFFWPDTVTYDGAQRPSWISLQFISDHIWTTRLNISETACSIGLAPLLLLLGAVRSAIAPYWFFALAAITALLLAMATPYFTEVVTYLPGTRGGDIKRLLFLFSLCAPVLVAIGAQQWLQQGPNKFLKISTALLGILCAGLLYWHWQPAADLQDAYAQMLSQTWPFSIQDIQTNWMKEGEAAANRSHLLTSFGHALAILCCLGVAFILSRKNALRLLILVTALDLTLIGSGLIVAIPAERITTPPRILQPLQQASDQATGPRPRLQRLIDPPNDPTPFLVPAPPNLPAYWGMEDLGAYNPLPKRRMEELFLAIEPNDQRPAGDPKKKVSVTMNGAGVLGFRKIESLSHPLLDLLGVDWILSNRELNLSILQDQTPAGCAPGHWLYQRQGCLPRATFLSQIKVLADKDERLQWLGNPKHRPADVLILEDPSAPLPKEGSAAKASIQFQYHRDEEVALMVNTPNPGYLRLADPFDQGWTVTVNQTAQPLYIADHYLRAVYLPAGQHEVIFRYNGWSVLKPIITSVLALLAILGLTIAAVLRNRKGAASS